VYQDLALCDNLDIVQTCTSDVKRPDWGSLTNRDGDHDQEDPGRSLGDHGEIGPPAVGSLSEVSAKRSLLRELSCASRVRMVILDEPTAALGVSQTAQVLELIKTLSSQGIAVLVISHNLVDVFAVADRIAVM